MSYVCKVVEEVLMLPNIGMKKETRLHLLLSR